jgi:hypothetical protein
MERTTQTADIANHGFRVTEPMVLARACAAAEPSHLTSVARHPQLRLVAMVRVRAKINLTVAPPHPDVRHRQE